MNNLQKILIACAVALIVAVGGPDVYAQPKDKRRDAVKRQQKDWREWRKREDKDRREAFKRENEYWREAMESRQEELRESRKQEKEYWKVIRKQEKKEEKEIRKQEKEYWKERRKQIKEERKGKRDDFREDWHQSQKYREIFPAYERRETFYDRYEENRPYYDNRHENNSRQYVRTIPRYSYEDAGYYPQDSDEPDYVPDEYVPEDAIGALSETNWLEEIFGIFLNLFSGGRSDDGLSAAVPFYGSIFDADLSENGYTDRVYPGYAEAHYQPAP